MRRELNASDTDISDVNSRVDDVMASLAEVMSSAQAVQDNITMTTPNVIDLSTATLRLTQLDADASNVDYQVHCFES